LNITRINNNKILFESEFSNSTTLKGKIRSTLSHFGKIIEKNISILANFWQHRKLKILNIPLETNPSVEPVSTKFIHDYFAKLSTYASLAISEEELKAKINTFYALNKPITLNPEFLLDLDLENILKDIDNKIKKGELNNDNDFVKNVVNDILLFGCLQISAPEKKPTPGSYTSWSSIEVLSPKRIHEILISIAEQKQKDLSGNFFLFHLIPQTYSTFSLTDKMLQFNLANFSVKMRRTIQQDPLYQWMRERPEIVDWMLNSSGSLEQNYLNTCVSTTFCQELLTHSLILPQAILLSEKLINKIKSNIYPNKEISNFVQKRMETEEKHLEKIKKTILENPGKITPEQMHQLTLDWSRSMQKISLFVDREALAHPTPKPIHNHWRLSAGIMTPVVLWEHAVGSENNPPSIWMRGKGIVWKDIKKILYPHCYFIDNETIEENLTISNREVLNDLIEGKQSHSEEKQKEAILKFWEGVHFKGALNLRNDSHAFYLKAVLHNGQKWFLISDPKVEEYLVLSHEQLISYFRKNHLSLSLDID